jgi:hypothetical protein
MAKSLKEYNEEMKSSMKDMDKTHEKTEKDFPLLKKNSAEDHMKSINKGRGNVPDNYKEKKAK